MVAFALATAALVGAPTASAHREKTRVAPATRTVDFRAAGTKGWRLEVTAVLGSSRAGRQSLGIYTNGPHHQSVGYLGVKGRATEDGRIVGRVPGFGRIDVQFEQTSETPVHTIPQQGCTTEGRSAILHGVFRGTIEFRGEGGYTRVARTSARGRIQVSPRELCPPKNHPPSHEEAARLPKGTAYLLAGRDEPGGSLTFSLTSISPASGFIALTSFDATYAHKRHGIGIFATTAVSNESSNFFTLTAAGGVPTELSLTPPGPFSGSGTFKLESPTQASWTGNLAVDIVGLGKASLAGPGWWAGACETTSTETFPPDVSVGFLTFSRLP